LKGVYFMSRKSAAAILLCILILGMASIAMAGDDSAARAAGLWTFFGIAVACGFGIGIAALGTGLAMGYALNGALQGTARNPEASGKIMTLMIIGLALIESLCIYALLICLIMVFKIPNLSPMLEAIVKSFGG
jgi:F-type H+-transporting ATPase subunit c